MNESQCGGDGWVRISYRAWRAVVVVPGKRVGEEDNNILSTFLYMRRIRGWCVKEEELELVMGCRSGGRSAPRGGKVEVEVESRSRSRGKGCVRRGERGVPCL